ERRNGRWTRWDRDQSQLQHASARRITIPVGLHADLGPEASLSHRGERRRFRASHELPIPHSVPAHHADDQRRPGLHELGARADQLHHTARHWLGEAYASIRRRVDDWWRTRAAYRRPVWAFR